jgi:hypothetical protein
MHSTPGSATDSDGKLKPVSGAKSPFDPKPDSDAGPYRHTKPEPRAHALSFPHPRRSPTAAEPR